MALEKKDGGKVIGGTGETQGDSPDSWRRRTIVAGSQMAETTPPVGKGAFSEMVRTTPSPLTAKIYVAVETENGEKKEDTWDWRGKQEGRILDTSNYSQSNSRNDSEKKVGRRAGSEHENHWSDDDSSDFASPLNGFG